MNKYHVCESALNSFVTLTFKEVNPRITLSTYELARLANSNLFVKSKLNPTQYCNEKKNANLFFRKKMRFKMFITINIQQTFLITWKYHTIY